MQSREFTPSRRVHARPFCNARWRVLTIHMMNSKARSCEFMDEWRAMIACMPAAIRPKFLASFSSTGCWCTSTSPGPAYSVTLVHVLEIIINFRCTTGNMANVGLKRANNSVTLPRKCIKVNKPLHAGRIFGDFHALLAMARNNLQATNWHG